MLTPKQIKIFGAFLAKPYHEKTYREIKEYSKEKSNSIIQKAILKFLTEKLITKRGIGNMLLYKINIENTTVLSYFDILINEQLPKTAKICITTIKQELSKISFLSITIFGSYAENKQKENSDLDVLLLVDTNENKRNCQLAMKSAELKCTTPLDAHVFTKSEMLEMLKDKEENLGKQIAKKHLAIHNPNIFYSTLNEAIKNGFQITP